MKSLAALFLFGAMAQLCAAFDSQELASARYNHTAMAAAGAASSIQQVFVARLSGREFRVVYRDSREGSEVLIVLSGSEALDARKNPAALRALRTALCAYLASEERNERAAVDVSSALCAINEPSVPVFSLVWLGSRGRSISSELSKIELPK
jgi:hypothetical protein